MIRAVPETVGFAALPSEIFCPSSCLIADSKRRMSSSRLLGFSTFPDITEHHRVMMAVQV